MAVNLLISLFVMLLIAAVPIIIGVYVYSDAKSRGMNAALWTLVAIFAPALVGLIIYLIVRSDNSQCPNCKATVSESFAVCPKCGAALKDRCPNCGFHAEPDWKVCPQCAAVLPTEGRVSAPAYKKDKGIGKVLAAVIMIPVVLLVLGVLSIVLFRVSYVSGSSMGTTSALVKEDFSGNNAVQAWFTECDAKPDGAYVLICDIYDEAGMAEYLVYLKGYSIAGLNTHTNSGSLFTKPYISADISARADTSRYELFFIETVGSKKQGLKLTLNGKPFNYESSDAVSSVKPTSDRETEKAAVALP